MISDFIAGAFCVVGGYTLALCVAELRKPAQTPHAECEKAPTLRRKYRDALPEVTEPVPQCQVAREVGGIDYKWINIAGESEQ